MPGDGKAQLTFPIRRIFSDFSSTIACVPEINPVADITFQE